jgi:hypothetical protein
MRSMILPAVFGAVLALGVSPNAPAADKQNTMSVTGCLQKQGDKAGEYSIVDADGKKYGLKSSQVKLEEHLNHKVTVTGKLKEEKHEASSNPGKTESGDITVTNLTMISKSCQ